jgi:hypothetical protein
MIHNIFNHFQGKFDKNEFFCHEHNIFNQEGNLRPTGSVEVHVFSVTGVNHSIWQ